MTTSESAVERRGLAVPAARLWGRDDFPADGPPLLSAPVGDDLAALTAWSAGVEDPVAAWTPEAVELPQIAALADAMTIELRHGPGVVRVAPPSGLGPAPTHSERSLARWELRLRLFYLAVGGHLGSVAENYGRLYDVKDRGVSYKEQAVPVSMTRESTGMHTDSSARLFEPDYVGLLCIRPARSGGRSRVVSAATVHRQLVARHPDLLARLYVPFIRDVVTPGFDRDLDQLRANAFPVYSLEDGMTFRYMRYWIESGHRSAGEDLAPEDVEAFDALDEALHDPANLVEFEMGAAEQMWVANRTVAHDRTAYEEDPHAPRLMVRQWVTAA